ncbi:LPS export ABC transporter permease LptF [Sediminimonas qiaohouensis]|uniref:LPS export ABC transporter permease LptF n=1 Tax=Sediminimonas qiaohouensis TaxID=552061 RepID=UPI00047A2E38|nr:LPS export ABC transporter permease LptF [Sediminimonas qiaohouensis]
MTRFDRYVLSQLMVLFGFFALILVSIYWINRAVLLFDKMIGDGQSTAVVVELTLLTLPRVIALMLPMAAFAAAVYVTNRMSSESELVVMQASGFSPFRIARPVLVFGLIVALMSGLLGHFLVPASTERMRERQAEISSNITAKLLSEGTFLHPTNGVTFYIRKITQDGALQDVFLSDRRDPEITMTYTAAQAYLTRDGSSTDLVMIEGLSQGYVPEDGRLFTTHFTDFGYDISAVVNTDVSRGNNVEFLTTPQLMRNPKKVMRTTGVSPGAYAIELHDRFNQSLIGVAAALIGFSTLLVGGFSRFGVWRQIIGAIGLLVVIKMIESAVAEPVLRNAALWPLVYLPSVSGFAIATGLLLWVRRPRRRRRAVIQEAPA